ncbi:cystathionine beta-lyase [Rhodobium orientis]|uniref:Cystathionine beta-lyase n=1 Tax=Rhodobium orientis TaxID=34017 RepID=A0A327JJ84_9HYPH|nr:cystathionine beta-lyase [Rhodobium orientis]MBB4301480.1 cystathionine beta-lyase [Rhodobium orientis]MBK5952177.1 cystathionine beta-lyase [Rhodobium orientis]RAI25444.1 cystathionine beta-lyase [Rhodobium orientis]
MPDRKTTHARRPATVLAHSGRNHGENRYFVNPPVIHASTVLYDSVEAMQVRTQPYTYGRQGTPTSEALETALNDLEGAAGTCLAPSGLAAISVALLSMLGAGDHLLMIDTVYAPTRNVCETVLKRMGVETTYFDPAIGSGIADLIRDNTRLIFLEAPGSLTFEMVDIPAFVDVAKARGIRTAIDNTWATPLFYRPLENGIDLSIQAGTKYIVGHSDVMLGTVSANEATFPDLKATHRALGQHVGPDDVYLALRGLRTMAVRLERHMESALKVARWLQGRPEVVTVRHPGLETDPGHAIWKRDFSGACGLFAFELQPSVPATAVAAFLDTLELFGLGYSWGGFESLAILAKPGPNRTATRYDDTNPLIRVHIGLEDPQDLIEDLETGFAAMASA